MNIPATLAVFTLFRKPSLAIPHVAIPTFAQLPAPLTGPSSPSPSFLPPSADIRAVVLDKDNCFAAPRTNTVHPAYASTFASLRAAYPGARLLIVSNSSGSSSDPHGSQAGMLEKATGVKVLRHGTKKPAAGAQIMQYFRDMSGEDIDPAHRIIPPVESSAQVAIVGDRISTDVIMANTMGAWGVWVTQGVVEDHGIWTRLERGLVRFLIRRGYTAPTPTCHTVDWP